MASMTNKKIVPEHLQPFVKTVERKCGLFDVKTYSVLPTNNWGKIVKFGSDDLTYMNNPELIELVPRGYSQLFYKQYLIQTLKGLPKFDGTSSIDEDDGMVDPTVDITVDPDSKDLKESKNFQDAKDSKDSRDSKLKCLEPLKSMIDYQQLLEWQKQQVLSVEWQEKANGKFAIFRLFRFCPNLNKKRELTCEDLQDSNANLWIFGGSKNYHVCLPLVHEINPKATDMEQMLHGQWLCRFKKFEGFDLHIQILNAIVQDLNLLTPEQVECLMDQTIVGEYVDGQHIVFTDKPYMVYFPTLSNYNSGYEACFGALLPSVSYILPTQNYLPTVEQLTRVRQLVNREGVVITYRNTKTKQVVRQKHKTNWYIILRCWREVLTKHSKFQIDTIAASKLLIDRLNQRSQQFLHLEEKESSFYSQLACEFVDWMEKSVYDYSDLAFDSPVGFAKVWHDFDTWSYSGRLSHAGRLSDASKAQNDTKDDSKSESLNDMNDMSCYLVRPSLFRLVIQLAAQSHKVAVVMSGLPGTGKTTVACRLMAALHARDKVSCSIHSTDAYFVQPDGLYVWDKTKLKEYHQQNFEAFCQSTAQVKIVDNTNTTLNEYKRYTDHAIQQGYICIVLHCKPAPLSILQARNTHKVPLETLKLMAARFKCGAPSYYGVFFPDSLIQANKSVSVEQKTPLHVTCAFIGGDTSKDQQAKAYYDSMLGEPVHVFLDGVSHNEAGSALVVNSMKIFNQESLFCENKIPHITLATRPGYKPVMVGQKIDPNTLESLNLADTFLQGIFAVTW